MKRIKLIFIFCLIILSFAQAQTPPNAFNYSAVARDASGQPISSSIIGIEISILKGSDTGVIVYSENHIVNTDAFGLFNLIIGGGAIQTGSILSIGWNNDSYYLKIGMDLNGGTNFLTMGITQFLSVPYAIHAATADSLIGGNQNFSGDYNDLINQPITISSISNNGDTLFLTNGQIFVNNCNNEQTDNLILPQITLNPVFDITSNSASISGAFTNINGNHILERGLVFSNFPNPNFNSNKIVFGSGFGSFDTIIGLDISNQYMLDNNTGYVLFPIIYPDTTYYVRAYALTENNVYSYSNELSFTTLPIGQIGPGGGTVFYDKGNNNDGWQYLEAAPTDYISLIGWGCEDSTFFLNTSYLVGKGEYNTSLIVNNCNDTIYAAKICDSLVLGGQNDWFLPSRDELFLMNFNLHLNNQGNFSTDYYYWSSSFENENEVWTIFFPGNLMPTLILGQTFFVRAIRAY